MNEIISDLKSVKDFFLENNKRFYIPEFQREFVWDNDIVKQLMDDFSEDTDGYEIKNDDLSGYLLGNIVLIKNEESNNYHVIDGQQRSISLSLLAKVLHERITELSKKYIDRHDEYLRWIKLLANLDEIYLIEDESDYSKENRIKVNTFLNYGDFYSELLRKTPDEISEVEPESKSEQNLVLVYNSFSNQISELSDKQLEKFTYYFSNKVKLIVTIAPSEDKAFQLFEVLNDRGKSLEPLDLIKNILLKQLYSETKDESERKSFNDNWQVFTENLEISRKRTISSSTFLKHYILANNGENVKKNELYSYVKQLNLTKNSVLEGAKDLRKVSEIYADIEDKKYTKFVTSTSGKITDDQQVQLINYLKLVFEVLGIKQFHSLLIPFYFESFETKLKILEASIKYGAAVLFAQRQTNMIESELENMLNDFNKKKDLKKLLQNIDQKKNRFIDEFATTLFHSAIGSRKQKAISLLKFVEIYGNRNTDALNVPKSGIRSITLEHILPQTANGKLPKEFVDKNEYNRYVNYLGNLTILKQADNSSIKNKSFKDKKETYQNSDYIMTKTLIEPMKNTKVGGKDFEDINYLNEWNPQYNYVKKDWNKKAIDERGKQLTEFIVELLK